MKITNLFFSNVYNLAYRERTSSLLYETADNPAFHVLKTNWHYWYADPLLFVQDEKEWLFAEKMNVLKRNGSIAVAEVENGSIGPFQEVLTEDFHLSYPMVFKKDGKIYMIPECAGKNKLLLYECVDFPYQWKLNRVLFEDVKYVDTNVFAFGGHYYLITGEMDPKDGSFTRTLLFDADRIEDGILVPHNSNSDSDYQHDDRGGGNLFFASDHLIRPTQYGDYDHYGQGLLFKRITVDEKELRQEEARRITTLDIKVDIPKKLTGIHTYCSTKELEIIDIQHICHAHPLVVLSRLRRKANIIIHRKRKKNKND